jgi:diacylglycerol O-acyltransferase / wax synthase
VNRLAGMDSMWLSVETRRWPTHVGGLTILDPGSAPDFGFERVLQDLAARIGRVPKLTWKVKEVPLGLGRPAWVEDRDFDVSRHFERVRVPPPGGRKEVEELVGRLMAEPLDRRRPLWKQWYIDGLAGGKVGLFSVQSHSLMDGMAGAGLSETLSDVAPGSAPVSPQKGPREPLREPSELELLLRSGVDLATTPVRVGRYVAATARRLGHFGPQLLKNGAFKVPMPPATALNRPVGPRRAFSFTSVSLADVKAVSKSLEVTVNDVLVGLCAEALTRYLAQAGQPVPGKALTAMLPVSMRAADDRELTNRVSGMMATLATDIADPSERIRVISRRFEPSKRNARLYRAAPLPSVCELFPPTAFWALSHALQSPLGGWLTPVACNAVISNVMGPDRALYVAGAKVVGIYSASILLMKSSINVTMFSSGGRVDLGIVVDPELVPDPEVLADAIPAALGQVMVSAGLGPPELSIDPLAAPLQKPARPRESGGRRP